MEQVYRSHSRRVYLAPVFVASDRAKIQSRPKYVFTDQIDQLIREIYLNHRDSKTCFGIRPLAKKVGMPYRALKKRARELGLTRTKELPWSEPELAILSQCAWMSDERIRLKLKAAGFARTLTAIHLKLKRMKFKHDRSFYSAYSLGQALASILRSLHAGSKRIPESQISRYSTHSTSKRGQLPHSRERRPLFHPRTPD